MTIAPHTHDETAPAVDVPAVPKHALARRTRNGTRPLADPAASPAKTKRPKPGQRRIQILQALAAMLESVDAHRVTTAALAARLSVSEAALYRHFASKAHMYEGLLDFIEDAIATAVHQSTGIAPEDISLAAQPPWHDGHDKAHQVIAAVLQFAQAHPGMVRVMLGDALLLEHERLQQRVTVFFDRIEATLVLCLRGVAGGASAAQVQLDASVMMALMMGRLHLYARSGFQRLPTEQLQASLSRWLVLSPALVGSDEGAA